MRLKKSRELMRQNPYDPPKRTEASEGRTAGHSGWWIAVSYAMPILIVTTFMNEAGWYGTGLSGSLQGMMRIGAFLTGFGCAYYVLFTGTRMQKLVTAPVAFGYTALVLGILFDNYW